MDLINYSQFLLKDNVKRSFEENYLKMLFEKHRDLPKSDIIEFIHKAQQVGANPSLNQIFLVERNAKVGYEWKKVGTVVFSYNFIQAIANQTGQYEGYTMKTGIVEKFDATTFESRKMLASECVVKRNGREFPYTAYFDEYVQTREDKTTGKNIPSGVWASKPYMMLEKCALSGALRRAFPEALSGLYCEEEMEAVTNELDKLSETKAIEAEAIVKVEKKEEVVKRINENKEDKEIRLSHLKGLLGSLTQGASLNEKMTALNDICGVKKFDDLKSKSIDDINFFIEKIDGIINENNLREAKKVKSVSDVSFKLE
jgi:phage recombination protein Bet